MKDVKYVISVDAERCPESVIPRRWRAKYVYAMFSLMQKDSEFAEKLTTEAKNLAYDMSLFRS